MQSITESWEQVFTKFLNLKFLLLVVLFFIIESLASLFLFGLLAGTGFSLGMEFLSESSLSALGILVFAGIILLVVFTALGVFFTGILLFSARELLENKGKFSISNAFESTRKRFVFSFGQQILASIIILAFVLVVFSPVIASALQFAKSAEVQDAFNFAFANPDSETAIQLLVGVLGGFALNNAWSLALAFLACLIAALVFTPALLLLKQSVFFESNSAVSSIKRALNLGFKNFFKNWLFFILFIIPIMLVSGILNFAVQMISSLQGIIAVAFSFLISLILNVFITATTMLFLVKIYGLNAEARPSISSTAKPLLQKKPFVKTPVLKRKK